MKDEKDLIVENEASDSEEIVKEGLLDVAALSEDKLSAALDKSASSLIQGDRTGGLVDLADDTGMIPARPGIGVAIVRNLVAEAFDDIAGLQLLWI